ncbi:MULTISPECIES: hypothetical protein [Niastella]|uniref:Peptide-N(4)-(N-acetyl-beta-glucosaminyl)asparagine amidase n=1 Tax=Niastella soli TaxID=2821487 RepID=A0ABS3Z108_9BACT|nr:hypothetical protein [Niastella soli]MBO9203840.1 hypothetical protein [Niastella soli]
MQRSLFYLLSIITILSGCATNQTKLEISFELAGRNKKELQKVISYFEKSKDPLKAKAAVFLIENLPYHKTFKINRAFNNCFDNINQAAVDSSGNDRRKYFESLLKAVKNRPNSPQQWSSTEMVKAVNADFLINNINLAFKAWNMVPRENRASFDEFCNSILPFFNVNEPVEEKARQFFFDKYHWVYDSLNAGMPFKKVADSIIGEFNFTSMVSLPKYYPAPLSVSQLEKSRLGLCDDAVNYFVNLFRSLGIICNKDLIVQWGNTTLLGHSWIHLKYGTFEYSRDVNSEGIDLRTKYQGESIPKVYRSTFSPLAQTACVYQNNLFYSDVTSFYTPTVSLQFPAAEKSVAAKLRLNVFNSQSMWNDVANCEAKNDSIVFRNVGVNCVYIVGFWENGTFKSQSPPFSIDADKKIKNYIPTGSYDSIKILRKLGLAQVRNKSKLGWINQLTDCVIEGANDSNFKSSVTLYKVKPFFSTQKQFIEAVSLQKFRYVRFYSKDKESYLAYLKFITNEDKEVKGRFISQNLPPRSKTDNLFDDAPETFCGGKDYFVGFEFDKPETISQIVFQPRNDDNAVRVHDNYTLFGWVDNNWRPIERKEAKDTLLYFHKVPRNCLFFLKDNTRGSEHHVFAMDEKGLHQLWFGFIPKVL